MAGSRSPVAFGRYVITRRIARGGMAEIYRARTRTAADAPSRWVAVKMMRPSLGHEELREHLFKREARIASAIDHPNVVPLYEFGLEMERYFLAMEYVRGRDLSHLLDPRRRGRDAIPFELALHVGYQAATGLGHAHRLLDERGEPLGIVHRDISPGNVMVGYDGDVKVLDFGVARMNESEGMRTQTGTLRGKFAYMSPEQTFGEALDARSDVFSLGTVLYELLSGTNCFRADNPIATLERVQRVRPVPPSRANREIPKSVDRILARCLAKDRRRRYPDCGVLAEAIGEFLEKRNYSGRDVLARYMAERFAWEKSEEERELSLEEEEVAIFDVVDFALVGEDGGLDAAHVAVSQQEVASQVEVHKAELAERGDEEEVFDSGEHEEGATEDGRDASAGRLRQESPPRARIVEPRNLDEADFAENELTVAHPGRSLRVIERGPRSRLGAAEIAPDPSASLRGASRSSLAPELRVAPRRFRDPDEVHEGRNVELASLLDHSEVEPRGDPALRGTDPDSARDREPRGDPALRATPQALRGTDPDSARDREPRGASDAPPTPEEKPTVARFVTQAAPRREPAVVLVGTRAPEFGGILSPANVEEERTSTARPTELANRADLTSRRTPPRPVVLVGAVAAAVLGVATLVTLGIESGSDGEIHAAVLPAKRTTIAPVKITLEDDARQRAAAAPARVTVVRAPDGELPAGDADIPEGDAHVEAAGAAEVLTAEVSERGTGSGAALAGGASPPPGGDDPREASRAAVRTAVRPVRARQLAGAQPQKERREQAVRPKVSALVPRVVPPPAKVAAKLPQKGRSLGFLNVGAKPWAEISIDGTKWPYQTPQAGIELPAGRHTITLSNKETGVTKTQVVVIKQAEYTTISVDMRKR